MEGEDDVECAVRPHLNAALAYLVHNILIVPAEQVSHASDGRAVHLAFTREGGVPRRALDRPAVKVTMCDAIPYGAPCPGLELILAYDPGGDVRRVSSRPDGSSGRISQGQPTDYLRLVDALEKQRLDGDGLAGWGWLGRGIAAAADPLAHGQWVGKAAAAHGLASAGGPG